MTGKLSKEEAAELRELHGMTVDARSAVSYAIESRRADPNIDPDGRVVEMAVDELRAARAAFERRLAELTEG
jgi:hypothetical protein